MKKCMKSYDASTKMFSDATCTDATERMAQVPNSSLNRFMQYRKHSALTMRSAKVLQECTGVEDPDSGTCYPVPDLDCDDQAKVDADPWGLAFDCFGQILDFTFTCINYAELDETTEEVYFSDDLCQTYYDTHDDPGALALLKAKPAEQASISLVEDAAMAEPEGFDYSAAAVGGSIGVLAALAAFKFLRRKDHDDFERM